MDLLTSLDQIDHVEIIRFHTRFIMAIPERITNSLLDLFNNNIITKKEYADFVSKIKEKRNEIIKLSDPESYEFVKNKYEEIYNDYCNKKMLAVILRAIAD